MRAVLQHHDLVGVAHGRQAVGDDEGGAARHQRLERLLDARLRRRVERAGRLVEDQDRRVLEQRAGDGQALALAARQGRAALADQGVVALRLAHDEVVRLGERGRLLDLGLRRIGPADPQVVADGAVEQRRILEHHADVAAKRFELDVAMVEAVDADRARLRVPHAVQQRHRGAFAGAGLPDQRDGRARRNVQAEMHQCRPLAVVGEAHILEIDIALGAADIPAVGLVGTVDCWSSTRKKSASAGIWKKMLADEARGLSMRPISMVAEAHEAHDLADRSPRLACRARCRARRSRSR